MRKIGLILILLVFGISILAGDALANRAKIGIPDFENKARVDGKVSASLVDMLVTAFVKSRKFDVQERSSLKKIAHEQAFGASGLVDPNSAAKIGQLTGVKFMVLGTVTEYAIDSQTTSAFGISGGKQTAKLGIDIRLVDTTTGRIMLAENYAKSTSSTSFSTSALSAKGSIEDSAIGELAREICDEIVGEVLFSVFPPKIIKVSGKKVTLNYGDGVFKKGDIYDVFTLGESLIDPDTGESLGSDEEYAGKVQISSVKPKFSKGKIIEEEMDFTDEMVLRPQEEAEKKTAKKVSVPW